MTGKLRRLSTRAPEHKAELQKATVLLRFRCTNPTAKSLKYLSYSRIANALDITYNDVQHICRQVLKAPRKLTIDQQARKLAQTHIDFLLHERTLELWSGYTMKERTVLFHRKYPHKKIAVTSLRRLYLKHGVRRKIVRQEKVMSEAARRAFRAKCNDLLANLNLAERQGRSIVYCDETLFSKRALPSREWSAKNTNLAVS